ncbi:MAG: hypothetical protein K2O65_06210 [Lachnospiraceae bacterium]|nr:hypothetical protein [Lachnospiraceae bacterium]
MLHIILFILKIIGIVLLCILGFLLLVILCALFVPVRYRIKVCREEGEGKPPFTAYVKITWLLHLVNILVRYPGEVIVRVRIFLITLFRVPKKDKGTKSARPEREKHRKTERKGKDQQEEQEVEVQKEDKEELKVIEQQENRVAQEEQTPQDQSENQVEQKIEDIRDNRENEVFGESGATEERQETAGNVQTVNCEKKVSEKITTITDDFNPFEMGTLEDEQQKSSTEQETEDEGNASESGKFSLPGKIRKLIEKIKDFIDKIKHTVHKIKALFENIQYTIRNFCDKIKSALDNIQYYREVMESDSFKQSMELCKGELGYVFRKLKPDKFEADLNVGMEDPATMGQILAVYGMLYPLIGRYVRLVADFESESTYIEGKLDIRGRIRTFTFLRVLIRVYMNKDIRKLIKLLKKEAV